MRKFCSSFCVPSKNLQKTEGEEFSGNFCLAMVLPLPRTQISLSRWKFARNGGREGDNGPSHGPLRIITIHSRFALASKWNHRCYPHRSNMFKIHQSHCMHARSDHWSEEDKVNVIFSWELSRWWPLFSINYQKFWKFRQSPQNLCICVRIPSSIKHSFNPSRTPVTKTLR